MIDRWRRQERSNIAASIATLRRKSNKIVHISAMSSHASSEDSARRIIRCQCRDAGTKTFGSTICASAARLLRLIQLAVIRRHYEIWSSTDDSISMSSEQRTNVAFDSLACRYGNGILPLNLSVNANPVADSRSIMIASRIVRDYCHGLRRSS